MLIITLNPSIDRTILVDQLIPGAEMRARGVRSADGGKGVNLARALTALGVKALSLTLKDTVPAVKVRVNTTVVDLAGSCTRFIEPGPYLSAGDWKKVEGFIVRHLDGARVLALCGSIPPGAPDDIYARLIRAARCKGILTVLDSSGIPLAKGVKAGPWCVKPNREEAQDFFGFKIRSTRAVRKALQMLAGYGMTRVLLSLDEDGLAGFDGQNMFLARGPRCAGVTVGCGDASLAGFLAGHMRGASFQDALRSAAAAGTANVGADIPGGITRAKVLAEFKKIKMEKM